MKRHLNQPLTTLDGTPIEERVGDTTRPLTLAAVAVNALLLQHEDERSLSGEDKVKRYQLAQKIHAAEGAVEVSSEQITLLKQLISKAYTPLVVGQAYAVLEADAEA